MKLMLHRIMRMQHSQSDAFIFIARALLVSTSMRIYCIECTFQAQLPIIAIIFYRVNAHRAPKIFHGIMYSCTMQTMRKKREEMFDSMK